MSFHPFVSAKADSADATRVNASNWNAAHVGGYNYLVNPGHEIAQRGAGAITANNAYTCDRHQIILAGTDTLSWTREGTTKMTNSLYSSKCVVVVGTGAGATHHREVLTIADGYHGLLGKAVTFSANRSTATAAAVRAYIKTDGTGGTTTFSGYHTGGGSFELLTVSLATVPTDATYVEVGTAFAASCTAYEDNDALGIGSSSALDLYASLVPAEEWSRAMRYFEVHGYGNTSTNSGQPRYYGPSVASDGINLPIGFAVRKAVAMPTMTKAGTWSASGNASGQPSAADPTPHGYTFAESTGAVITTSVNVYPDTSDDTITAAADP